MNPDTVGADKQAVQNLAEHVYQLMAERASEREARIIYAFARSLLTPKH